MLFTGIVKPTGMAASSLMVPQSRLRSRKETTAPTRRSHEWPSRAASPCRAARGIRTQETHGVCVVC
eukprot:5772648-Prymnesium_polylepis.1